MCFYRYIYTDIQAPESGEVGSSSQPRASSLLAATISNSFSCQNVIGDKLHHRNSSAKLQPRHLPVLPNRQYDFHTFFYTYHPSITDSPVCILHSKTSLLSAPVTSVATTMESSSKLQIRSILHVAEGMGEGGRKYFDLVCNSRALAKDHSQWIRNCRRRSNRSSRWKRRCEIQTSSRRALKITLTTVPSR